MNLSEVKQALANVIAIPVSPFDARSNLDIKAYRINVTRLADAGVKVFTPNGNTSEFYALTPEEQTAAVAATIDVLSKRESVVIAGVGYDEHTAVKAAHEAHARGAHAIMIHQPVHPYQSAAGWLAYHEHIARAVPELGVIPYVRSAVASASLARLAERCPNVIGVKYALRDPLGFAKITNEVAPERLVWVCGLAELWAPFFWVAGARGFTSGLVNVYPQLSLRLLHCLQAGDRQEINALVQTIRPFEAMRARRNDALNVSVIKEAMAQLELSTRYVRPPISELSPVERDEVSALLQNWDLSLALPARA